MMSHSHETVPFKHWVLRVFCLVFDILFCLDFRTSGADLDARRDIGVIFEPWKVPPRDGNMFYVGISQAGLYLPCFMQTEVTDSSWFICLAALSLHTWICWVNPSTEMKSRRVKWWLVLFREGYLWPHRPDCLLHHITGPQTVEFHNTGWAGIRPFLTPLLPYELLMGLMDIFFIL